MLRRQEHNMWSEESRGQQRGARGQQFEAEWTVTQAEREGEERMMSRESSIKLALVPQGIIFSGVEGQEE